MARLEIRDGLYQQLAQQADQFGLPLEDWLERTTSPELQALYDWFFGLMAHDLRAPLAAIMTSTEILKYYQARLTEDRRLEHLDSIQSQIYLLTVLMSNARTLQQIAQQVLDCQPTMHELVNFVESVCQDVRNAIHNSHDIAINAVDGPLDFQFDERLLKLALSNVLLNAAQYSPPARPIQLTLAVTSRQALITVVDHGLGIPTAEQDFVFDLHYRGSNVPDNLNSGLGLTVAQRVLALHGGSISLTSQVDKGTTVYINLPA